MLIDFLRCSVTYLDVSSLLHGLNSFINDINNNKISCILKPILRIKNGFNNILKWKSFNDAEYCDLKLNLLFQNNTSNNNNNNTKNQDTQIVKLIY